MNATDVKMKAHGLAEYAEACSVRLDASLYRLLAKFEGETGLTVESIEVNRFNNQVAGERPSTILGPVIATVSVGPVKIR